MGMIAHYTLIDNLENRINNSHGSLKTSGTVVNSIGAVGKGIKTNKSGYLIIPSTLSKWNLKIEKRFFCFFLKNQSNETQTCTMHTRPKTSWGSKYWWFKADKKHGIGFEFNENYPSRYASSYIPFDNNLDIDNGEQVHLGFSLYQNSEGYTCFEIWLNGEYQGQRIIEQVDLDIMGGETAIMSSYPYQNWGCEAYISDLRVYDYPPSNKEIKEISLAKYVHLKFEDDLLDSSGYNNNITTTSTTHHFSEQESKVGEKCLKAEINGVFNFPNIMTSLYPFASFCFYYKNNDPINLVTILSFFDTLLSKNSDFFIKIVDNKISLGFSESNGLNSETVFLGSQDFSIMKHIAITIDFPKKTIKFYINSELLGSFNFTKEFPKHLRTGGRLLLSNFDSEPQNTKNNGYLDDFRMYGSILNQSEINRIINERYFIDNKGNLFCYKKKIAVGGKGFKKNGVVEFDGFHENDIDGSDGRIMRNKQGNILGINKIIEGY